MLASDSWMQVGEALTARGQRLFIVEAGAGGALAATASARAGASRWFLGGLACYHDSLKTGALNLPAQVLVDHGAVSPVTVAELARGGQRLSGADWVLAESGVYGPGGGSPEKPVGCVYLSVSRGDAVCTGRQLKLSGDRAALRQAVCEAAAAYLLERIAAADISPRQI